MCDYEADEQCPVWDEHEHIARKAHTCSGCRESIHPGHRYRRTATLFDGSWSTWKHCLRCAAMVDALRPVLGERFTTETLDLNCGEVWEEPPEHVAALAFLLPGEPVTALLESSP